MRIHFAPLTVGLRWVGQRKAPDWARSLCGESAQSGQDDHFGRVAEWKAAGLYPAVQGTPREQAPWRGFDSRSCRFILIGV